jgi:organic radical activating enzyme
LKELIAQIKYPLDYTWTDYPDDYSQSVLVYFLGCERYCKGCQNELFQLRTYTSAWDFSLEDLYDLISSECYRIKSNTIIFSGGDCLSSYNIDFTKEFLKRYCDQFQICIYTGATIEEVKQREIKGFTYIKVGKYDESLKQESFKTDDCFQLASSNQEIYDSEFNLLTKNGRMEF